MKAVYVADVAYQKYVLEHCGVRITGTYIVSINNDYVYDGKLDLERLFQITDNLLKYCELDTYAMVKVWGELVRVLEGDKI